jgi:hypothetical protein
MRMLTWLAFASSSLLLIGPTVAHAQEVFPAQELKFDARMARFASKAGNPGTYVLLGSGYLRTLSTPNENEFINHWLEVHPHAMATPISTCSGARAGTPPKRIVYVWIEDGAESLNVALIEEGIFVGGVMVDMVESQHRLLEEMRDPKLAGTREQLEKEIAAQPESDRVKRLISDADYAERRKRIEAAEAKARNGKKGIWSDAMKAERQAEEIE